MSKLGEVPAMKASGLALAGYPEAYTHVDESVDCLPTQLRTRPRRQHHRGRWNGIRLVA
jgi:hypothetical protein